jgi:hypothetical protein
MNEELDWMMQAMQFKFGYALGLSAWVTALRVVMVFINDKLREFAEGALPADKAWVDTMLNNRGYRLFCFLLNAVASVKLPGRITKPGDTVFINKPADPPAAPPMSRGSSTP